MRSIYPLLIVSNELIVAQYYYIIIKDYIQIVSKQYQTTEAIFLNQSIKIQIYSALYIIRSTWIAQGNQYVSSLSVLLHFPL